MTKLLRDEVSWAISAGMSKSRLWLVVEGVKNDVAFYDRLLSAAGVKDCVITRVQDVRIDGTSAGGKKQSMKLFKSLEATSRLQQENSAGKVDIVMMLDADDDSFAGMQLRHSNIIYTKNADVEAEIFVNADVREVVSSFLSIPRALVAEAIPDDPVRSLAIAWREWICLRLASFGVKNSPGRFATSSRIHAGPKHELVHEEFASICADMEKSDPEWQLRYERATEHFDSQVSHGDARTLVKGKWLPSYLFGRVRDFVPVDYVLPKIDVGSMTAGCISTVDYDGVWDSYYKEQFVEILDR